MNVSLSYAELAVGLMMISFTSTSGGRSIAYKIACAIEVAGMDILRYSFMTCLAVSSEILSASSDSVTPAIFA